MPHCKINNTWCTCKCEDYFSHFLISIYKVLGWKFLHGIAHCGILVTHVKCTCKYKDSKSELFHVHVHSNWHGKIYFWNTDLLQIQRIALRLFIMYFLQILYTLFYIKTDPRPGIENCIYQLTLKRQKMTKSRMHWQKLRLLVIYRSGAVWHSK